MKTLFSFKSLIVLTLVAFGLSLGAASSRAEMLGPDSEILIRTTGQEATFNYAFINFSNWSNQDNMFGMPRRDKVIEKGDSVTLNSTYDGLVSLTFTREDNGNIRVDFPAGILSKKDPDDGCGKGIIAKGCNPLPGEIYGVGFYGQTQERIYSEYSAYLSAEGMKIYFRTSPEADWIPLGEDGSSVHTIYGSPSVKIKVEGYPGPKVPGPHGSISGNENLTSLDVNDYLHVKMAYNLDNPANNNMVDQDDQQLTVVYREGGMEKSETFPLDGGHEFRIYGPEENFVRAIASVGFPDDLSIEAESNNTAFTKIEYWTTGNNPELKGTFSHDQITKVLYHCFSGSFSYVNKPDQNNQGGIDKVSQSFNTPIVGGDKLTVRQDGPFLSVRTTEPVYVKPQPKNANVFGWNPDSGDDLPKADFDPVDPKADDGKTIDPQGQGGGDFKVDSMALGGGGCSLSVIGAGSLGNLWGLLALALPLALTRFRRK